MADRLTENQCRKSVPPAERYTIVFDSDVPGFALRVTAGGTKAFVLDYRVKGTGRQRRVTIGRFPSWSVSAARERAKALRREIDEGGDPRGAFEEERAAPTVDDLIARFCAEHLPKKRPVTHRNYSHLINNRSRRPRAASRWLMSPSPILTGCTVKSAPRNMTQTARLRCCEDVRSGDPLADAHG